MAYDPTEASVHSWDISTGVDGPGTRFVLFLAGYFVFDRLRDSFAEEV